MNNIECVKAAAFNLERAAHDSSKHAEFGMYAALRFISTALHKCSIIPNKLLQIARHRLMMLICNLDDNWNMVRYDLIRLSGLLKATIYHMESSIIH